MAKVVLRVVGGVCKDYEADTAKQIQDALGLQRYRVVLNGHPVDNCRRLKDGDVVTILHMAYLRFDNYLDKSEPPLNASADELRKWSGFQHPPKEPGLIAKVADAILGKKEEEKDVEAED